MAEDDEGLEEILSWGKGMLLILNELQQILKCLFWNYLSKWFDEI